jgi:YcxB-like protein
VEYTAPVTERDFVRAYWLNSRSPYRIFVTLAFGLATGALLLALATSWIYARTHPLTFGGEFAKVAVSVLLPAAIVVVFWTILVRVMLHVMLTRRYRESGLSGKDVANVITAEGLQVTPSKLAPEPTPWINFRYWRESGEIFVVSANSKEYCVLPKSALSSEQQKELRTLLAIALRRG